MKYLPLLLMFIFSNSLFAQWKVYPNSPYRGSRFDDVHFHTKDHGTIVGGNGQIHTTFNGGETWISSEISNNYFRSVGFINELVGFTGSLEGNVFKTIDGGETWSYIGEKFPISKPILCGISCVEGLVFATGNYTEPAEFFKSTDEGESWEYTRLDSLLSAAVEVQFLNADEGYISGMGLEGKGTIIYTSDGGNSWKIVGEADYSMSYIWKLQFLESGKAYGSVQNFMNVGASIVRRDNATSDWTTHIDYNFELDPQGIGFIDDNTGWLTGYSNLNLETHDGGETWKTFYGVWAVNRIIKLDDNTMLAIGDRLYKYEIEGSSSEESNHAEIDQLPHRIISLNPNPSRDFIKLVYELTNSTLLTIDVFDLSGNKVLHIVKGYKSVGRHENTINISNLVGGNYFIALRTSERHLVEKFLINR